MDKKPKKAKIKVPAPKKRREGTASPKGAVAAGGAGALMLEEASIPYGLAFWLGLAKKPFRSFSDFDIVNLAHEGITKRSMDYLAAALGISRKTLAENIFDISVKTLERKDPKAKLDKKTSSQAIEVARVLQHAYSVFRDEEKVKRWLNHPNRALNDKPPVQLFDTLTGINMVNAILGRIEEGVYT